MKCYHCNSEVADGTRFCPYCGNSLSIPQQGQQGQYQQPQQGQYQQPQQGQYQQPQQGQYQQPQQGQYQQPYQGQYQQPQQGQYQQQSHYQQSYQSQYQQRYGQQKPQLPQNPRLSFGEAINIASHRLQEVDGRSRRSEYWWWLLAVGIGGGIIQLIPYLGSVAYLLQYGLLFSITIRRLNDVPAPEWLGKAYLGLWGPCAIMMMIWSLSVQYKVGFINDLVDLFGFYTFRGFLEFFMLCYTISSILVLVYLIKDSNPEIDPMYGPSPKYTL